MTPENERYGQAGTPGGQGGTPPPLPDHPPTVGLPAVGPPAGGPPSAAQPVRAVAVALLNLSGLGLGYVLLLRWLPAAVCWAATAALLLIALPADADGVPGGLLIGYAVLLLLAAAHGAWLALRTPTGLPLRPALCVGLGLVLLAAPAGGAVAYGAAQDEAVERMLLERLDRADALVKKASDTAAAGSFGDARPQYRNALTRYRELAEDHPESRAAQRVPDRLDAYYKAVAAPYRDGDHCAAVEPLEYLRSVPKTIDRTLLGDLADWPDGPLAASLYGCGMKTLGSEDPGPGGGQLGELLRTFPTSEQAPEVEPAVQDVIRERAGALRGDGPCEATAQLRRIADTVRGLPEETAAALRGQAGRAVGNGEFACGVDQFKDEDFVAARETLTRYVRTYKDGGKSERAWKIAVAAEIAQERPAAGKRLPPGAAPGGSRTELAISNDAPYPATILYTGPVTGKAEVATCKGCKPYPTDAAFKRAGCKDGGRNYPKSRLRLPTGNYHFLVKYPAADENYSYGQKVAPDYTYTLCVGVTGKGW